MEEREFPPPRLDLPESAPLTPEIIAAIAAVRSIMSTDETRYVLCSVCLDLAAGTATATDGRRLAIAKFPPVPCTADRPLLIPSRAITPLCGGEFVKISHNSSAEAAFTNERDLRLQTKLIDGQYPNVKQAIPETIHSLSVRRLDFVAALTALEPLRVAIVKLTADDSSLLISTHGYGTNPTDERSGTAVISCESTKPLTIGMNLTWLREAAEKFCDETLVLGFTDACSPIRIESEKLLYVQMPVRLT
jgi:DNA polymerase III sliding clamp (beta) subunit (PCNA family)